MSFLSMNNNYMKPQSNTFLLPETDSRNTYLNDNKTPQINENNNQISASNGNDRNLQKVWTTQTFETFETTNKIKRANMQNYDYVNISWANKNPSKEPPISLEKSDEDEIECTKMECEVSVTMDSNTNLEKSDNVSPSHHTRRPMNAFLIFCKKHRPIVRQKYASLENRGVTRILGEWWALLEPAEKKPYTDLAKEHKDAFLIANPDFRWYKLPAPPLRTLNTRPPTAPVQKAPEPISSPSKNNHIIPEFTPGKLADESQLGGLSSLMNNNFSPIPKTNNHYFNSSKDIKPAEIENNNNNRTCTTVTEDSHVSPVNLIKSNSLPPKPIKKRIFEQYGNDKKAVSRNVLRDDDNDDDNKNKNDSNNMTNQELVNKVVEGMFATQMDEKVGLTQGGKERKSDRLCKGKRYEQFMSEGKLLGNKRDTKLQQQLQKCKIDTKIETELNNKLDNPTPKLDLSNTIKRLRERTNVKVELEKQNKDEPIKTERVRTVSEASDSSLKSFPNPTFNLDIRITNLPSLSYDMYLQRKKASKKRKIRTKSEGESKTKQQKIDKQELVGSKKRKNKKSITHLGKNDDNTNMGEDLAGLAVLAEIAAKTEKINE